MILAILQARVSSTRLPGKVLKPILGQPMLARQIERLGRMHRVDKLIVATSLDFSDNPIEKLCGEVGVHCFRGSLDDVLDRYYWAAKSHDPEHVVRLTGDCPLTDRHLIGRVIDFHLEGEYDYTSNTLNPSFPNGLDVEVIRFASLFQAWKEAKLPSHREHVTPFIQENPHRFNLGSFRNSVDLSFLRWTVDESVDFELVTRIYEALYPNQPDFTTRDILAYLDAYPQMKTFNTHVCRNAGLRRTERDDRVFEQRGHG
jgi:spore coat polysaccharide biosynthesis protein SpsF